MFNPDPVELAKWQLARDREYTTRWTHLVERKLSRMGASPLAYLRGAAPLFFRLLAEHAELRDGPEGEGWICGDAHVENFGVYRADGSKVAKAGSGIVESSVVFDVNDFDEAVIAPLRFDVLRLATSLILGARELGVAGKGSVALVASLIASYSDVAFGGAPLGPEPRPVKHLVDAAEGRSHRDLLESRTTVTNGRRGFLHGERYQVLPENLRAPAIDAFQRYARLLAGVTQKSERFEVLDVAFRVAGTGSLGSLRIAVLTRGKADDDDGWLFDMKEERLPAASIVASAPADALAASGGGAADRVLRAMRACIKAPPRMLGTATLGETSLFVRRLTPQEDKLDFAKVEPKELDATARHLGALLGRAHRRGLATLAAPEVRPWTQDEQQLLADRAIVLSGVHEAAYLAMCKLS